MRAVEMLPASEAPAGLFGSYIPSGFSAAPSAAGGSAHHQPAAVSASMSSFLATFATDAIRSPSLRFMTRTPWVLRPTTRISDTWVRFTIPCAVMSMMSSPSRTDKIATTGPLRSLVRMSRTPLPPRRCLR